MFTKRPHYFVGKLIMPTLCKLANLHRAHLHTYCILGKTHIIIVTFTQILKIGFKFVLTKDRKLGQTN